MTELVLGGELEVGRLDFSRDDAPLADALAVELRRGAQPLQEGADDFLRASDEVFLRQVRVMAVLVEGNEGLADQQQTANLGLGTRARASNPGVVAVPFPDKNFLWFGQNFCVMSCGSVRGSCYRRGAHQAFDVERRGRGPLPQPLGEGYLRASTYSRQTGRTCGIRLALTAARS